MYIVGRLDRLQICLWWHRAESSCVHHLLLTVETADTTHNSDDAHVRSVLGLLEEQQSNYVNSQHTWVWKATSKHMHHLHDHVYYSHMHVCTHLHMNIDSTQNLITYKNTARIQKCTPPLLEMHMHDCVPTWTHAHTHAHGHTHTRTHKHFTHNIYIKGTQRCRGTHLAGNPGMLPLQTLDWYGQGSLETDIHSRWRAEVAMS